MIEGTDVGLLPYSPDIFNAMFEAKLPELSKVADKYKLPLTDLKYVLGEELSESKMKTGACNTALDFLIVKTLNDGYLYKSIEVAIQDAILASGIYYVNVLGKGEYV